LYNPVTRTRPPGSSMAVGKAPVFGSSPVLVQVALAGAYTSPALFWSLSNTVTSTGPSGSSVGGSAEPATVIRGVGLPRPVRGVVQLGGGGGGQGGGEAAGDQDLAVAQQRRRRVGPGGAEGSGRRERAGRRVVQLAARHGGTEPGLAAGHQYLAAAQEGRGEM